MGSVLLVSGPACMVSRGGIWSRARAGQLLVEEEWERTCGLGHHTGKRGLQPPELQSLSFFIPAENLGC